MGRERRPVAGGRSLFHRLLCAAAHRAIRYPARISAAAKKSQRVLYCWSKGRGRFPFLCTPSPQPTGPESVRYVPGLICQGCPRLHTSSRVIGSSTASRDRSPTSEKQRHPSRGAEDPTSRCPDDLAAFMIVRSQGASSPMVCRARFAVVLLVLVSLTFAQGKKPAKPASGKPAAAQPSATPQASQLDEKLFSAMRWRQVGPFRGGRVLAVTGVPGEPSVFYFGGAAGGVWKTTDAGANWQPVFDKQPIASIGAIAVATSDHNIIYAGSGEACIRGNISYGNGVYKCMDGGKAWKNVGLKDSRHIGAVIVDPRNANTVFVAALGHAYGPNEERGLFRSRDGGVTWQKVLYKDNKTGAIDVVFDPNNANTLFASLWEVYRTPWSLSSGGPGSGLYKSTDGGSTWARLEGHGLPSGIMGRIGVSVSGADSNRVYAMIENKDGGGLYRSDH